MALSNVLVSKGSACFGGNRIKPVYSAHPVFVPLINAHPLVLRINGNISSQRPQPIQEMCPPRIYIFVLCKYVWLIERRPLFRVAFIISAWYPGNNSKLNWTTQPLTFDRSGTWVLASNTSIFFLNPNVPIKCSNNDSAYFVYWILKCRETGGYGCEKGGSYKCRVKSSAFQASVKRAELLHFQVNLGDTDTRRSCLAPECHLAPIVCIVVLHLQ